MINLLFDLNNIAMRSLYIVGGYGTQTLTFDSQSEIDQLVRKMSMDISFLIRTINPSRIIFALDSKSWRKNIKIEENEGYKGQRIKSSIINWNNVYNALEELSDIMQKKGMIVTKIESAEADDIIALWNQELFNNQHQHVIVVSGDEDMRQLVREDVYEDKYVFSTVFNPFLQGKNASRKLYIPEHFEEWMNTADKVDFMNMKGTINVDKDDFHKIITSERTKFEFVDGRMIALRKIFCGDDGDNVPAFYTWLNDKNNEVRLTNSKFEKIYAGLLDYPNEKLTYEDLNKRIDRLNELIIKICKSTPPFKTEDRLNRQVKLVVLDKSVFPEEIVNKFEEIKKAEFDKPRVNKGNVNMRDILEGTRYVREKKNENEASIFKEIDRINKTALF